MKKLLLMCLLTSSLCYAKSDDGGSVGPQGPQGPQGPAGPPGQSVVGPKGDTGAQGQQGLQGVAGRDFSGYNDPRVAPMLELDIRHYDGKYLGLHSFTNYTVDSNGNLFTVGLRIMLKLGPSYEEKQIEELKRRLR